MADTALASTEAQRALVVDDLRQRDRAARARIELANKQRRLLPQREAIEVFILCKDLEDAGYPAIAQQLRRGLGHLTTQARRSHRRTRKVPVVNATRTRRVGTRTREHRSATSRRTATATSGTSSGDDGPSDSPSPRRRHPSRAKWGAASC